MTSPADEYATLLARAAPFLRPPGATVASYGQVAVTGDLWLRAAAEPYLRNGLPELPLSYDEQVDALVQALAELDAEFSAALRRAAWDPAKHPRGPDGRFLSTVDSLKDAIRKHRAGGRRGGDPFDGFDREQLRRVAKGRGIELARGEDRESIAAKLLADLGGKPVRKPKAKASKSPAPPKVPPPPPRLPSLNPSELTGVDARWWTALDEDTGMDRPVPVRDLEIGGGYILRSGLAYRIDGITFLVEDGTMLVPERVVAGFRDVHAQLPPEADTYQRGYAWLAGRNPADAYWEAKYQIPNFQSAATAGDGAVRMWARQNSALDPGSHLDSLFHEFGHNVSSAVVDRDLHDTSATWARAGRADSLASRPTDFGFSGRLALRLRNLNLSPDSSRPYPNGVSRYGTSSAAEDYAESMAFYLAGNIGTGRLRPGGPQVPIYFRDFFPERARVLDQVFPQIAQRQRAAISAR